MSQKFDTRDVLRLEIERDPEGLVNLVQNPNGELGGWGWVSPVSGTAINGSPHSELDHALTLSTGSAQATYAASELIPVTPGQYVAARLTYAGGSAGASLRGRFEFFDSNQVLLSSGAQGGATGGSLSAYNLPPTSVPANAAFVRLRLDLYTSGGMPVADAWASFSRVTVATAATSADLGSIRRNLVPNPSFENNIKGWTASYSGTIVRSAAQAAAGSGSLLWTAGATYPAYGPWTLEGKAGIPVTPGTTYTVRFQSRAATTPRTVGLTRQWFDAKGTSLGGGTDLTGANTATGWTDHSRTLVAPARAAYLRIGAYFADAVEGEQHYVDAFQMEATTALPDYFDGSTPDAGVTDYSWLNRSAVVSKRENLVKNSNFETNTDGWRSTYDRLTKSTPAYSGTGALRADSQSTNRYDYRLASTPTKTEGIPVTPGEVLYAHLWLRMTAAFTDNPSLNGTLYFYDAAGNYVSGAYIRRPAGVDLATDTWIWHTGSFTVPEKAKYVAIGGEVLNDSPLPNSASMLIDNVYLSRTPGDYFDASTPSKNIDFGTVTYAASSAGAVETTTIMLPYSTAVTSTLDYVEPVQYADILGESHEIRIGREALNVGTLEATVLSSALDPATSALIRPGRRCRLLAGIREEVITETVAEQARNLVQNPSFETNATGWGTWAGVSGAQTTTTETTGGKFGQNFRRMTCTTVPTTGGGHIYSWRIGVSAQKRYRGGAWLRPSVPVNVLPNGAYFTSTGAVHSSVNIGTATPCPAGVWTWVPADFTAPSGDVARFEPRFYISGAGFTAAGQTLDIDGVVIAEATAEIEYFDGDTPDTDTERYDWTGTPHASASTKSTVSTLVTLSEPTWEPVFTGKASKADVTYELKRRDVPDDRRARIELVAVDPGTALANTARPEGVAKISELPWILEGAGVPWNCDGSQNQVSYAEVVSINENATAMDQIAITRDTVMGHAWVDRRGILQAHTQLAATGAKVLTEADYSGLDVSFSTEDLINEVKVNLLTRNGASTEETPLGPYADGASVRQWGRYSAEFTVHGLSNAGVDALAAEILKANATPKVRVNSVTLPVAEVRHLAARALVDVNDAFDVRNAARGLAGVLRARRVEHTITPSKWMVALNFSEAGSVATPTVAPPVQTGARPDVGKIDLYAGTAPPAGHLLCDGRSVLVKDYPYLHAVIGYTYGGSGASFNVPNLVDRFPVGAGSKALGTSGGSPTHRHDSSGLTAASTALSQLSNTTTTGGSAQRLTGPASHTHNVVGDTGLADSLPPWRALNFIIRAI